MCVLMLCRAPIQVCKDFWGFCNTAGAQDVAEWCAEDDSK